MATTLTPNLKLRVDSNLTANSKYNLNRIDLLGATFLVDSTNTLKIRSQTSLVLEPNSADIGGNGTGGTVEIGTNDHQLDELNIYVDEVTFNGTVNVEDIVISGLLELSNGTYTTTLATAESGQTEDLTLRFPNNNGTATSVLSTDGTGNLYWADPTFAVTSVDFEAPTDLFSVSGVPITSEGTITLTKVNQEANKVLAGPTTGTAAQPTFRSLVLADLPTLTKSDVGLGNVDNTSDADKPISTDTQDALDLKYDASNPANYVDAAGAAAAAPVQSVAGKTGPVTLTSSDVGLGNVPNEDATNPANIDQTPDYRFVTDTEKSTWNGKQDALGYTPLNKAGDSMTGELDMGFNSIVALADPLYPQDAAHKQYVDTGLSTKQDSLGTGTTSQFLRGDLTWQEIDATTDPTLLDNIEATRLGYKKYLSNTIYNRGFSPTVTSFFPGETPISDAVFIPYQTQDGSWRLKGSIPSRSLNSFYGNLVASSTSAATTSNGFNNTINVTAEQADSKLLVGGLFTSLNGITRGYLARLNSDGSPDTTFNTNVASTINGQVRTIAVQSDGKILVGGAFVAQRSRLFRYLPTGLQDGAFNVALGTAFNNDVYSIIVQPDGKIIVAGAFTTFTGLTRNRIIRLNSDGTEDTAFYSNLPVGAFNNTIQTMAIDSSGKIVVGGTFTTLGGNTRNRIARLNSDGTEDTTFYTNVTSTGSATAFDSTVNSIAINSTSQKILVAGAFANFNGLPRNAYAQLNSDGTPDIAFNNTLVSITGGSINTVAFDADNKILAVGSFGGVGGVVRSYITRINANGAAEDTAFYNNLLASAGIPTLAIQHVYVRSNTKVCISGGFTTTNSSTVFGISRNRILQVFNSGIEDGPPQRLTYALEGIDFSSTTPQQVSGYLTLGTTVTNSNTLTLYNIPQLSATNTSAANTGLFNGGASFEVDIQDKPSWAYGAEEPLILSLTETEVTPEFSTVEMQYESYPQLTSVVLYKLVGASYELYGSISVSPSPMSLGGFNRPLSGSLDDTYKVVITNAEGSTEDTFIIPAQEAVLVPQILGASASSYSGAESLLIASYLNTTTSYLIEYFSGGIWQSYGSGSISDSSPFRSLIMRMGMGIPTQYRVTLTNTEGSSTPAEFMISANSTIPLVINSATVAYPDGSNFTWTLSYTPSPNYPSGLIYESEKYIGSGNPYADLDPSSWTSSLSESVTSNPFTSSNIARPAVNTVYRVRIGQTGVIDSMSSWYYVPVDASAGGVIE